jgi:hypothetical protein
MQKKQELDMMDKPKTEPKRYMIPKEILQKSHIKEEVGQTVTFSIF